MAVAHDDNTISQRHGLDLIMRYVDDRGLHLGMKLLDLGAHLRAQLRIKIGKRFVEQEHFWITHDSATHSNTLALTARKLCRAAFHQCFKTKNG